ncbi:unnamed protein product [Anisakis simplex]|uniref:Ras-related protein Rab-33 (inferred by orthology to a C. elegans protein) n=1 Tax=Anisakis simplex TaxID=6269 RepID=A0A0M3J0I4_ANISI|nr:unnamed protein product [Anisakis simplex]
MYSEQQNQQQQQQPSQQQRQHIPIVHAPQVTTIQTHVLPQTSLSDQNFSFNPSNSPSSQEVPSNIARIPYPSSTTSNPVTHHSPVQHTSSATSANSITKPFKTKRVFKSFHLAVYIRSDLCPGTNPNKYSQNVFQLKSSTNCIQVIILGDAGVGKTCLSFRFCNGRFPAQTEATIGVDFRERSVVIDGELIRVQLWDTAGQERYRQSMVSHYYRNVNAVVFVYDVSNEKSFESLATWISECRNHSVSSSKDTPHIIIGNKCDLNPSNRVKTDYAQIFADQNDMALFETSALSDSESDHVESIFMTLVHKLQQSKPMHVQSDEERALKEERLLLKANEVDKLHAEDGWCC